MLLNPDDVKSRNLPGSVGAATMNGKLYAYPMTADNGYFLYYDASVLSAEDVQSVDTMLEKAAAAGKKFMMSVNDAWYIYSFYAGAGLVATLADDGINTVCNWNEAPGADVTQAILDITANPASSPARMLISFLPSRTAAAAPPSPVLGTPAPPRRLGARLRRHQAANYTLNGEQVQMGSFSGYKLVGVNPHSANVGVAMMLADFITNEDNQNKRFNDRKLGPSNINANASEAVQSAPAIAALAEQSSYATLQRVGANYWSSAASRRRIRRRFSIPSGLRLPLRPTRLPTSPDTSCIRLRESSRRRSAFYGAYGFSLGSTTDFSDPDKILITTGDANSIYCQGVKDNDSYFSAYLPSGIVRIGWPTVPISGLPPDI